MTKEGWKSNVEEYSDPLTEEEIKKSDEIFDQMTKLADQLPQRVEYFITVGGSHVYQGTFHFLVISAAEGLTRMIKNIVRKASEEKAEEGVDAMMTMTPVIQSIGRLIAICGRESLEAIAKKYRADMLRCECEECGKKHNHDDKKAADC